MNTLHFDGFDWTIINTDTLQSRPRYDALMRAKGIVTVYIVEGQQKRKVRTLEIGLKQDGSLVLLNEVK